MSLLDGIKDAESGIRTLPALIEMVGARLSMIGWDDASVREIGRNRLKNITYLWLGKHLSYARAECLFELKMQSFTSSSSAPESNR